MDSLRRAADYAGSRSILLGVENETGLTARVWRLVDIAARDESVAARWGRYFACPEWS